MSEWVYPIAVTLLTFVVCIPTLTALAIVSLRWHRKRSARLGDMGGSFPLMCLAAPSAVPLLALFVSAVQALTLGDPSAAATEAEVSTALVCMLDHMQATACLDNAFLVASLFSMFVATTAWHLWPQLARRFADRWSQLRAGGSEQIAAPDVHVVRRVQGLLTSTPALRSLRVTVLRDAKIPAATVGLLRPHVLVDERFVCGADDDALTAALLHEAAHARDFDPLRMLFTNICLTLNPTAGPLRSAFAQWRQAREANCDDEAVRAGGAPLALASALVRAARFRHAAPCCEVHLTGPTGDGLQLRLTHLMIATPNSQSGACQTNNNVPSTFQRPWLLTICAFAAVVPMAVDTGLVAYVHRLSEFIWLGFTLG